MQLERGIYAASARLLFETIGKIETVKFFVARSGVNAALRMGAVSI